MIIDTVNARTAHRKRHDTRDVLNQFGDLEDHVGTFAVLLCFAVHLEPQANLIDGRQPRLFNERSELRKTDYEGSKQDER